MNQSLVSSLMKRVLEEGLGLDLTDPNLKDTPVRISRMYCQELFSGLTEEPPKITTFPNTEKYDEMIFVDNSPFVSVCSHHFLPFSLLFVAIYRHLNPLLNLSLSLPLLKQQLNNNHQE